jgi:hypothetical protein
MRRLLAPFCGFSFGRRALSRFVIKHLFYASIASTVLSACAYAVPITFTLQGVATGRVNFVPFTAAPFTITYSSDTAFLLNDPKLLFYPRTTASISIVGVGNGTLTNQFQLTTFVGTSFVTLSDPAGNTGGFVIIYPGLAHYPFSSAFGPVQVVTDPGATLVMSPSSFGNITFNSVDNLTFGATTSTSPPPTPIPSTLILALTGIAVAGLFYQRLRLSKI